MPTDITPSAAKLVPALRYRDLAAAMEWLCIAFGFEKHRVIAGEDGAVAVAQLTVGDNMIMLLPVGGSELDRLMAQPDEIGGLETQSSYLAVDDIDFHYATAKAAGAQFVLDLKAYDNGGRGFSCRDPEGHIWNFGTYDPWEGKSLAASPMPPAVGPAAPRRKRSAAAMMAVIAFVTVVAGMAGWTLAILRQPAPATTAMQFSPEQTQLKVEIADAQKQAQEARDRTARIRAELAQERSKRQAAERVAQEAREALQRRQDSTNAAGATTRTLEAQLIQARRAKETAERAAEEAREALQRRQGATDAAGGATRRLEAQLAEERRAKEAAERVASASANRIEKERTAKRTAQNATLVVQKQLALARAARRFAEQSAKKAAEELARERAAREAAERAAKEAQAKLNRALRAEKSGALAPTLHRLPRRVSRKSAAPVD